MVHGTYAGPIRISFNFQEFQIKLEGLDQTAFLYPML